MVDVASGLGAELQALDTSLEGKTSLDAGEIAALRGALRSKSARATNLETDNAALTTMLADAKTATSAPDFRVLDSKRKGNRTEKRLDATWFAVPLVFAALAYFLPTAVTGWLSVIVGMLYTLAVIAAVAVMSDTTYECTVKGKSTAGKDVSKETPPPETPRYVEPLSETKIGDFFYYIMPTRLCAVLVVAATFIGVWSGFGALYTTALQPADQATQSRVATIGPEAKVSTTPPPAKAETDVEPYQLSFLTLATFEGPAKETAGLTRLIIFELVCAILVMLAVLGLLINRLSEF